MRVREAIAALALVGSAALAAPAQAVEPLDAPGKTAGIELVDTTTSDGYEWELFRNRAYPCSVDGYQTFAVGTRIGSSPRAPRPLWVRMRGGGVGYFDAAGDPQPSPKNKSESDAKELISFVKDSALNQLVHDDRAGFRTVSVSMCSHDIYGGGDHADPNNPNRTPDGRPRTVNGLVATKAAIQFVQERYPTTKTFLHGTSAGSFGSWGVAWSLQRQDRPVAGFVADSGVANLQYERDQNAQSGPCARREAVDAISARLHPALVDPANQPDRLIARGALTAPVFNVWSRDDGNSCGEASIRCTMPGGSVQVLGAMECRMSRVSRAIAALPARRRSRTWGLCVRAKQRAAPGTCARHVVTDPADLPNTDPAFPADYNRAIMDWVRFRLAERLPALEPRFSRGASPRARGGRVRLRCIPGGYERRTCRIGVRQLLGRGRTRLLGEGAHVIAEGADSTVVAVKLNRSGRRVLGAAPRGVRVRLTMRATEDHTRRTGTAARRARLRR